MLWESVYGTHTVLQTLPAALAIPLAVAVAVAVAAVHIVDQLLVILW